MDKTKLARILLSELKSARMLGIPGPSMDEARCVTRAMKDFWPMFVHFFLSVQLRGFSGSPGPIQSMTSGLAMDGLLEDVVTFYFIFFLVFCRGLKAGSAAAAFGLFTSSILK
ncbi:hypothetical protein MPH_12746 [Macrophomina phaseolina MS6]|uniref:Uncharacterized protein n=1 Tax=Macrophomina phaseolina (strain MS6) TaxID=1126212 RepID=K2QJZ6_MACPH|nr:hypothetical protein MPH_12746 [Macrophomina phaseolina MS6]